MYFSEGQWMNEGVNQQASKIGFPYNPSSPKNPSPFSLEPSKESDKLSDLFNAPVSGGSEEQSFFDSINPQHVEDLESVGIEVQPDDKNQGTFYDYYYGVNLYHTCMCLNAHCSC